MIDPLLSLSFNLHAQKGTYALLLGSGLSRSASIPTGWEVTLDLVSKLAHMLGVECQGREADWYAEQFKREPSYSDILPRLAPTSAAQQQLLKAYFEPTEQEREEGKKLPTSAHKAIARLVATGHVRVIVTTNFDRLMETALEAEGITPVVITSPDAAKGAPPLVHSKCTVIKVHGDYLDHRIKNSVEALSRYDRTIDRLLNRVFDEYGLIICGWSADYDIALRAALERSKARRYPAYWTGLSEPRGAAKDLIALLRAQSIQIIGADSFFVSLVEKVTALEEFDRPHPLSIQAAVVALKRYLSEDRYRIQLRDFLMEEAQGVRAAALGAFGELKGAKPDIESAQKLMQRLEAATEKAQHLFAALSFYARGEQVKAAFDAYEFIGTTSELSFSYEVWSNLKMYPALLSLYAAGIVAVASRHYELLGEIAARPSFVKGATEKVVPATLSIHVHDVMERDSARVLIPGMQQRKTPVSDHLLERLRPALLGLIPDDTRYERAFDGFEYLWCLLCVDARLQAGSRVWTPFGAFIWRWGRFAEENFAEEAHSRLGAFDSNSPLLSAGLFGGKLERLQAAHNAAHPMLIKIAHELHFR